MDKRFISEISKTAVISGWLVIIISLLGNFSPWFVIISWLGVGIGGLVYLLNLFALFFLVLYGRKKDFFARNLLLIISYLILYPFIFNMTVHMKL